MNRVSLRNKWLKLETSGELAIIIEEFIEGIYLKLMKAKPEDFNMEPVGFRITRILTDYAPKTSRALVPVF